MVRNRTACGVDGPHLPSITTQKRSTSGGSNSALIPLDSYATDSHTRCIARSSFRIRKLWDDGEVHPVAAVHWICVPLLVSKIRPQSPHPPSQMV